MSNIHPFPQQDARYDEASRWISGLDRGLSTDETKALQAWLADADNAEVLLSMAKVWDKMDSLSRLAELFPVPARRRSHFTAGGIGIAASLLLAVLGCMWVAVEMNLFSWDGGQESPMASALEHSYETAVGEQRTVILPDGTEILLNTNSLLHIEYTPEHRLFTLERGELHVHVAKDESRPLSVIAGEQIVQAVGTQFNIEIKDDREIELLVTEGRVRVGLRPQATEILTRSLSERPERPILAERPELLALPELPLIVSAGEELVLGAPDQEITPVSLEEIERKLSWRNGNLVLQGEPLEEAVGEIGRYTSVEFVFLDDSLRKIRVAGLFKAGDVDGLLATLRDNFGIAYQRVGEQTVFLDSQ